MTETPRWRVFVHALDRTGPPMLARGFLRWMAVARASVDVEVLAFRGGELRQDMEALGPVTVVLEDGEPWDAWAPDPVRFAQLRAGLATVEPATVNLLVSVAAAQVLPLLPPDIGPVATWVVEVGEDLHWFDDPVGLVERTDVFLAGSQGTADELDSFLPAGTPLELVAEFVEEPVAHSDAHRVALRREMGASDGDLLVLGSGIGTVRKGLDLFAEVAAVVRSRSSLPFSFCWIGGVDDPLYPRVAESMARPELGALHLLPPVADLDSYLAAADVFLHPARRDAFPLVCISAAAAGTPVVAFSGSGGPAELLGEDLLSAPFPDTLGLAEVLVELLEPTLRADVGQAQRRRTHGHLASCAAPKLESSLGRLVLGSQP